MSTADEHQRITVSIERVEQPATLAGKHLLSFHVDEHNATSVHLTQGELLDLWGKIGAYFNLAGMGEHGERQHEHRYSSQVLRHSHDGGNEPHGYFGHAEDYPQETPGPDDLYNVSPVRAVASKEEQR